MRGRMLWTAPALLALVAGCHDAWPAVTPPVVSHLALITAIRYPDSVTVEDDVIVRFTVVVNPCETLYWAEDHPDGDTMRFSARSISADCVSASPTTHEVEFLLQRPQRLPRTLIFAEPDGADSVRVIAPKGGA